MKRISKLLICITALTALFTVFGINAHAASLQKPKITTLRSSSYNSAYIKWGTVDDAESYILYRSTDNKNWKKVTQVTSTSYTDKGLSCGSTYYYTLRAVSGSTKSGYNSGVAVKIVPATPKVTKTVGKSTTSVSVTWSKIAGADGYIVYRSSNGSSGWTRISVVKSGSTVTYLDESCTSGNVYYYTVKAYRTVNNTNVTSGYQKPGTSGIPLPATVKLSSAVNKGYNSVKVNWKSVTGATAYRVYRKYGSEKWSLITTVKGNSSVTYTDTTCTTGIAYTYTVRAVVSADGNSSVGGYNATGVTATPLPAKPALIAATPTAYNTINVSWKAVTGSTHYYIYRKTGSENWKYLGKVTKAYTQYSDKTCLTGTQYTYTVRAVVERNGQAYRGGYYADGVSGTTSLSTPALKSAVSTKTDCITLTYGKVPGASGYIIYRKTSGSGYKNIAVLTNSSVTSYTDKTALCGNVFTYTVKAYINVNGKNVYSGYERNGIQGRAIVSTPKITNTAVVNKSIRVTFKADDRVSYLNIYRYYTDNPDSEALIGTVPAEQGSFTDTSAVAGIEYFYKVKAYIKTENGDVESDLSNAGQSVKIPLDIPQAVTAVLSGDHTGYYDYINISFTCNSSPAVYTVYRSTDGSEVFEKIAQTESTSYTDKTALYGVSYRYRISAWFDCEGTLTESSLSSASDSVALTLKKPIIVAAAIDGKSASIAFVGDLNANRYCIYRSVNGGESVLIATTPKCSYTDTSLLYGNSYAYTVSACRVTAATDTVYETAPSAKSRALKCDLAQSSVSSVELSGKCSAIVSFTASAYADGYRIYRRTQGGTWLKICETDTTVYTDNDLTYGESYEYAVSAIANEGDGIYETPLSAASSPITVTPPTPIMQGYSSDTEKIGITFVPEQNINTYKIYRRSKSAAWSEIALITVSESNEGSYTYEDKTADYGIAYDYCVSSIAANGMEGEKSEFPAESARLVLPVPQISDISVRLNGFIIECAAIPKADGYKLYKLNSDGNFIEAAATVDVTEATVTLADDDVSPFTDYSYAVSALFGECESNISKACNKNWQPAAPVLTVSFAPEQGGYSLAWDSEYYSDSYKICRKTENGSFIDLSSTSNKIYTDKNILFSKDYTYKIEISCTDAAGNPHILESSEVAPVFSDKKPTALWIKKAKDNKNFIAIATDNGNGKSFDKFYIYRSDDGVYFTYVGCQTNPDNEPTVYFKDSVTGNSCSYCIIAQDGELTTDVNACIISGITETLGLDNVSITPGKSNISVEFSPIDGCTRYDIYRAENYTTAFEFLNTIEISAGSTDGLYTDTSAKMSSGAKAYYYSVVPNSSITYYDYASKDKVTVSLGFTHNTSAFCIVGVDPVDITLIAPSENGTYIKWNKLTGATGYKLYRSDKQNGDYVCIKELSADTTEYTDTEKILFDNCYYKVLTYATVNDKTVYSDDITGMAADFSLNAYVEITDVFMADDNKAYINCSIDESSASRYTYHLFRREGSEDKLSYIGSQRYYNGNDGQVIFCDDSAQRGIEYEYAVIAANGMKYSATSDEVFGIKEFVPTLDIKMFSSDGYCKISTSFDSKIDTLNIYRSTSEPDKWELIKTYNNSNGAYSFTYNDNTVKEGYEYYYKIAVEKNYEYYSYIDTVEEFSCKATAESQVKGPIQRQVSDVVVNSVMLYEDETTGLLHPTIWWDKLSAASGYRVYRKHVNGDYKLISGEEPITAVEYTDTSVLISSDYSYAVEAVYYINGKTLYSIYENSVCKADFSAANPGFKTTGLTESDTIGFEWTSLSNTEVCKYYIYRRVHGTQDWQLVTSKLSTDNYYYPSHYDAPPRHNIYYDYTMCALVYSFDESNVPYHSLYCGFDNENSVITSDYPFEGTNIRYISAANTDGEVDDYQPLICWYRKLNCDGYVVMRKTDKTANWQEIARLSADSSKSYITYTDTSAGYFDNCYYSIAAYNNLSDGTQEISLYDIDGTSPKDGVLEIFELMNEHRAANGSEPLVFNDTLWKLATMRSVEISESFSHTRPDGTSCYTAAKEFDITYSTAGENIATSFSLSQESAFEQWKESEGHNENMLDSSYDEVGIGFYYSDTSDYRTYWTQFFIG